MQVLRRLGALPQRLPSGDVGHATIRWNFDLHSMGLDFFDFKREAPRRTMSVPTDVGSLLSGAWRQPDLIARPDVLVLVSLFGFAYEARTD